jgi:predicted NBD/HSP70 family sugar kinase
LPARQPSVRGHNLALVLRAVVDGGPASRAQIAAATGLTKASVSGMADALLRAGLLAEGGVASRPSAVGRPGSALSLAPLAPRGIGLEINVDYVATCTVDLAGRRLQREVVADDLRGLPVGAVLDLAARLVARAADEVAAAGAPVAGLAVAVPGLVEEGRGRLLLAPNLGWDDVPVAGELERRLPRLAGAVRLDNEANLGALGELWCGGHRDGDGTPLRSFLHVSGEVGIGAGIVLHGELLRGLRGFAGEIGHVPVAPGEGRRCRCGAMGCLEMVAGQEALLRAAGLPGAARSTGRSWAGPVAELVAAAGGGDARALAALDAAGRALGVATATVVNLLDVGTVLLGGVHALLAPWLRAPLERELAGRVLAARVTPVRLLTSTLGGEAAVRGAATWAARRVVDDPAAWLAA